MKIKVQIDYSVSYEMGVYICDRQMLASDCLVPFCFLLNDTQKQCHL